jgi:hypothetical protein
MSRFRVLQGARTERYGLVSGARAQIHQPAGTSKLERARKRIPGHEPAPKGPAHLREL